MNLLHVCASECLCVFIYSTEFGIPFFFFGKLKMNGVIGKWALILYRELTLNDDDLMVMMSMMMEIQNQKH